MVQLRRFVIYALLLCAAVTEVAIAAQIEEVMVTVQRREESMQDVPAAISVMNGSQLRFKDISSLDQLDKSVPGLVFSPYSDIQPEIAIRGVGTKEDGPAANDSTVVSIDDVYIASRLGQIFDIYDLERVEVLRGPQGTLYGRNSIGGSINFVTKKPSEVFEARLEQTFGEYNKNDTRGFVSGPLIEEAGLFGKLSFSRRTNDGYTESFDPSLTHVTDVHDKESLNARAQLVWAPGDTFEAVFSADMATDDNNGTNREPVNTALNSNNVAEVNQDLGFTDPFDSLNGNYGFLERDVWGVSAKLTWTLSDSLSITSITSARDVSVEWEELCCGVDPLLASSSGTDGVEEDAEQLTQELQINGTGEKTDWVVGIFVTKETDHRIETYVFPEFFIPPAKKIINPDCVISPTVNCVGTTDTSDQDADIFAWAVFGQLTRQISEKTRITAGLRYSKDDKELLASGRSDYGGGLIVDPFDPVKADGTWDSTDFRLAIDYSLNDDILLYASAASGFKSGGFTGSASTAAIANTPFDSEQALSYEMGLKGTWLDNSLRTNVTAFFTDYEDLQVTRFTTTPAVPVVGEFLTENAGEAELKGVEIEVLFLPTDNLSISGSYAYLDATYTDFSGLTPNPAGEPVDFTGNVLRQAPENTAHIDVTYFIPLSSGASIKANVGASYVDEIYFDPGSTDPDVDLRINSLAPSYTTVDARVAYTSASGLWEVVLWGKNLTDEEYFTQIFTLGGGSRGFGRFGAPSWYGVTATLNFGG